MPKWVDAVAELRRRQHLRRLRSQFCSQCDATVSAGSGSPSAKHRQAGTAPACRRVGRYWGDVGWGDRRRIDS